MLIRMLGNADGKVAGLTKALFAGQSYDVIDADAERLIAAGLAVGGFRTEAKAVHGPPEDKALKAPVRRKRK